MSKYDNNIDYRNSKPVVVDIELYDEMKTKAEKYDALEKLNWKIADDERGNVYVLADIIEMKNKSEKYDEIVKIENSLNGGSIRSGKKPYALQILIERDEALKRIEDLKEYKKKAMTMYKEEEQRADKLGNQTIALNHRIEELEQIVEKYHYANGIPNITSSYVNLKTAYDKLMNEINIYKNGVKSLISVNGKGIEYFKQVCDDANEMYQDEATKIKEMLELVEVEE